jgi:hypothetical protein
MMVCMRTHIILSTSKHTQPQEWTCARQEGVATGPAKIFMLPLGWKRLKTFFASIWWECQAHSAAQGVQSDRPLQWHWINLLITFDSHSISDTFSLNSSTMIEEQPTSVAAQSQGDTSLEIANNTQNVVQNGGPITTKSSTSFLLLSPRAYRYREGDNSSFQHPTDSFILTKSYSMIRKFNSYLLQ